MRSAIIAFAIILLLVTVAQSIVITKPSGKWPADWPEALEPLRESARTIKIGTGIQQSIYEITFRDRESFEKVWPVLVQLKTPGAPLTLYRVASEPPRDWGDLLSNAAPIVRIYAPSEGIVGDVQEAAESGRLDPQIVTRRIADGRILKAGPPWPQAIVSPTGELPEFVVARRTDGTMQWTDAAEVPEEEIGFRHRARVDIDLVVDGQVIDLNRNVLPGDAAVVDRRFAPRDGE